MKNLVKSTMLAMLHRSRRRRAPSARGAMSWMSCGSAGWRLEAAAHHDRVPQLAVRPPVLPYPASLLGEAAPAIQRDRSAVVGEDLEAEFVQPLGARPLVR